VVDDIQYDKSTHKMLAPPTRIRIHGKKFVVKIREGYDQEQQASGTISVDDINSAHKKLKTPSPTLSPSPSYSFDGLGALAKDPNLTDRSRLRKVGEPIQARESESEAAIRNINLLKSSLKHVEPPVRPSVKELFRDYKNN
jgi:hypothetical protein